MFEKQRLDTRNILEYTEHEDSIDASVITNVVPLLQDDYGEAGDCTLTSITSIIKRLKPLAEIEDIYNVVEHIARKYGYRGDTGTISFTIKTIYQKSLNTFNIDLNIKTYTLKNIGYNFNRIKKSINNDFPVLLNLWKDGRSYYRDHSILITGYYETSNYKMLQIQDNWYKDPAFIDYNKLSTISSIQIIK